MQTAVSDSQTQAASWNPRLLPGWGRSASRRVQPRGQLGRACPSWRLAVHKGGGQVSNSR